MCVRYNVEMWNTANYCKDKDNQLVFILPPRSTYWDKRTLLAWVTYLTYWLIALIVICVKIKGALSARGVLCADATHRTMFD